MKKVFFLYIITSTHIFFAMEQYFSLSNVTQTVWDKLDPLTIIGELQKNGVSLNAREKMTQMHRLDRVIPYCIDKEDTANLCTILNQIFANKWPLSLLAQDMAADYLWKKRPAIFNINKPLLKEINSTLDILEPAQIICDIKKGQLYYEKQVDVEDRVNRALDELMKLKRTDDLKKLVIIITPTRESIVTKEEITIKEESFSIVPGERILKAIYQYFRLQEKENKKYKDRLLAFFKNIQKNDSDKES